MINYQQPTKMCCTCRQDLTLSLFSKNKSTKDGLHRSCKECTKLSNKRYRLTSNAKAVALAARPKRRMQARYYSHEKRKIVLAYAVKAGCIDCGIKDPFVLEFDHIDQNSKISSVSRLVSINSAIEIIADEISKCVVRCSNCHKKRTAQQFNWYQDINLESLDNVDCSSLTSKLDTVD